MTEQPAEKTETAEAPSNPYVQAMKDQQAIEEAKLAILQARQKQVSAYLPDLSNLKGDALEAADANGNPPVGAAAATANALKEAASEVARALTPQADWKIFVTSEQNLARLDGSYRGLTLGIEQLSALAKTALDLTAPTDIPETPLRVEPQEQIQQSEDEYAQLWSSGMYRSFLQANEGAFGKAGALGAGAAGAVVTAAALAAGGPISAIPLGVAAATGLISSLPSLLAAFQTKRTVSGQVSQIGDLAATLEVASALHDANNSGANPQVVHHEFRFEFQDTEVEKAYHALTAKRQRLIAKSMEFAQPSMVIQQRKEVADAIIDALEKELDGAEKEQRDEILDYLVRLGIHLAELNRLQVATSDASSLISSAADAIDAFTTAAQSADGATGRSPYADAVLMSGLLGHAGKGQNSSWKILLVKALPGTSSSSREDGGIGKADGFLAIGEVPLAYALIQAPDMALVKAGTVVGDFRLFTPISSAAADAVAKPGSPRGKKWPWQST